MAPRQPASGRRSWREAPTRHSAKPIHGSKAPIKWLLSLALVGLLAVFAWLVWQPAQGEPRTHFVALLTGRSDMLTAPPVLFEEATLAPLRLMDEHSEWLSYVDASDAQGTADISTIASQLAELPIGERDRLIVYVSAHGISNDGVPMILARNYDVRNPEEGLYSAVDLIEAASRVPAATKLLVFDCSRLAVHPRLGMAANEFNSLIAAAAREVDDPNLAILLPGSGLETSPYGLAEGRSVLGGALVDALLGDADAAASGDDDRNVSMAELEAFVVAACGTSRVAAPTPQLLGCGPAASVRVLQRQSIIHLPAIRGISGVSELIAQARPNNQAAGGGGAIAESAGKSPPATKETDGGDPTSANGPPATSSSPVEPAPAAPSTPAEPTAEAAAPETPLTTTSAPAETAPGGITPATPPPSGTAPAPPAAAAPSAKVAPPPPIIQAWRLRDRLASDASISEGANPVDYAPHLWSELNAKLVSLHLEALQQKGGAANAAAQVDLIQPYLRGLERIAGSTSAASDGLVTDELNAARQEYSSSEPFLRLRQLDARYAAGVLDVRRRLFLARQFVEWHAATLGAPIDPQAGAEAAREIEQFLQTLAALDDALAAIEQRRFESWDDAAPLLRTLDDRRSKVQEAAARLTRRIEIQVNSISQSRDSAARRELESFLASDAATAPQREALLSAMKATDRETSARKLTPPSWRDFVEHLRLEALLVQTADPAMKDSAPLREIVELSTASVADDRLAELARKAGRALREFYAALPSRIARSQGASLPDADVRILERSLVLVYASDVTSALTSTVGFLTPRLEPPAELVLVAPPAADIRAGIWTPLEWTVELQNLAATEVRATLEQFDAEVLDVRFGQSESPAQPGDSQVFAVEGAVKIALRVQPKSSQTGSLEARTHTVALRVTATTGAKEVAASREARLVVARPNRIDLVVQTVEPPIERGEQRATNSVELHPYPNRSTTFRFGLANFADEAKNLHMELIAAPMLQGPNEALVEGGWPPGRLLDEYGQLPEVLQEWVETELAAAPVIAAGDIALPADEQQHLVALQAPSAPPPAEPAAPEGAAATPPPVTPPPSVDVTHGLICRITNKDRPDEVVLKWIEVAPLRPSSYFDFEPGRLSGGNVSFLARPTDVDDDQRPDLPPQILEKPVSFLVRGDGVVFPAGRIVPLDFTADMTEARLEVQALEDVRGRHSIAMDVDGVPRALVWDVDFDQQTVRLNNSPATIRIVSVGMPSGTEAPARVYRTTPSAEFDEKVWSPVVDVGPDRACSFDVSRPTRSDLEVRLQVDAPWNAFNTVGDGSAVVVAWEGYAATSYDLYYDRSVRSEIVEFNKAGEMVIRATVGDIVLRLPSPGVNYKVVPLTARLRVQGKERNADRLKVVFDQSPPQIESLAAPSRIWLGTSTVELQLGVVDLSGIERVEAWFTPKRPQSAAELDPKAAELLEISDTDPYQPEREILRPLTLTATAPKELGTHYLTVRVTDRSGQSADTHREDHAVRVEEKIKPVEGPLVGDLKGRVMLGSKPAPAGLTVLIKENPGLSASTDDAGRFVIKQVEAGMYTLVVEGLVTSRPVAGEQAITLAAKADYEWKAVVKAAVEWADPPKE